MNNRITLFLALLLMLSIKAYAQDFETATEAVKNMGVGWNLGNTLDSHDVSKTWTTTDQHETCWGQPVTKPELLKMMKEAGFGAIRVPVTWFQEMDSNGKVNDAWMKRVKEVVDYVIDNGMYCILNVHHDTGADGGNFKSWIKADEDNYNQNKDKFEGLWKQIAEEFKDYDQHLLFEGYNEMLDKLNSWNFASSLASGQYDATVAESAYKAINNYIQSFVKTVRNSGGNNDKRNLIVNTYGACNGGGTWSTHLKDPLKNLSLPEGESNHIAVEVHGYPNIESGLSGAKSYIDDMFNALNTYFISKGTPVIIGEWGTSNVDKGAGKTDYDLRKNTMFAFVDYWIKTSKDLGIATFYWMGLSDGAFRDIPAFNQADLAERIVKAYHGDSYSGQYPTASIEYIVKYIDDWSEAFLYGDWGNNTIKVSDYKGIRVETDNIYGDKLQIKVYGDKDGTDNYKTQEVKLSSSSTTTTVDFDASALGATIPRITLQTLSGAQTVRIKSAKLIKADGTETDGNISMAWGCEVTGETVTLTGIKAAMTKEDMADDKTYNLQGQQVQNPQKGIYIKNGKKYIAK